MTEHTQSPPLSPTAQKFVLHWGEMGTRWGINRTVAQIHALLFVSPRPLPADEIAMLARGSVVARGTPTHVLTERLLADHYNAHVRVIPGESGPLVVPIRPRPPKPPVTPVDPAVS